MSKNKIEIEYCDQWNYFPKAASFAEFIENKIDCENILNKKISFIKGSGGAFEVFVNGNKIFSKLDKGRFPEEIELVNLVKNNIR